MEQADRYQSGGGLGGLEEISQRACVHRVCIAHGHRQQ